MRIAPHLVVPLGCLVPTHGFGLRGKQIMRIALFINDLISRDRNASPVNGHRFERGKVLSKTEFSKILPSASVLGFNGAALWHDALVMDTERLTLALINDAYNHGACVANYVKAVDLMVQKNRILGVAAEDTETDKQFNIRARTVVNAAGPWIDRTLASFHTGNKTRSCWARGMNIVVNKNLVKDFAIGLEGSAATFANKTRPNTEKRFFFFVPWRGHTMIGTTYKRHNGEPDDFQVNRQDIEEFINQINLIYPPADLDFKDVSFFHAGILPASKTDNNNPYEVQLAKRSAVIDHESKEGIKGLVSVRGVKYTTAPYVARKVLKKLGVSAIHGDRIETAQRQSPPADSSASTIEQEEDKPNKSLSPDWVAYLESKYGEHSVKVSKYITEDKTSASLISRKPKLITAEVLYAMREEMALHLSDVVFRRTGFGNVACPSRSKLEALTDIMAQELGWSSKQKADEIFNVLKSYHPLPVPTTTYSSTKTEAIANFNN
jgi:glycerol-3-phosphate dehydrogenase